MPFLPDEPDVFPETLFDDRPDAGPPWWVAHTRPRQEKATVRHLLKIGFPYYLPCETTRVKVGKRVRPIKLPIFSGYVFARAEESQRWRMMASNRIASLQRVVDQERFWSDLRRIRAMLDLGRPIQAEESIRPGTPVTLRGGPMTGMTGTVVKETGGFRFVVMVDFIGRGLSVTVDGEWLGLVA